MRYERKYKVSDLHHHVILQTIRMHPAGLRKIYPDRQINNIYFDSTGLQCYHDNVDGIGERKKFRVRWYGDDVKKGAKLISLPLDAGDVAFETVFGNY